MEVDPSITRFTQDNIAMIAGLMFRYIQDNREEIQANPLNLYWNIKVAATRFKLLRYMLVISKKHLGLSNVKLYNYLIHSLSEIIDSYVNHYEGAEKEKCVLYFDVGTPEFKS